MQKKIIAAAIIGMVSVGASAATVYDKDGLKVSLGGKFDFAASYTKDATKNKFTFADGKYSTSRFTIGGQQDLNSDLKVYLAYDLRFDDVYTGKKSATTGGVSANDAMKGGLESKKFGKIEAGTVNVAAQQYVFKKFYVNAQESEIVKTGIVNSGIEALSNRTIWFHTSKQLPVALKGSYSIAANRANDAGKNNSIMVLGAEFKASIVNGGFARTVKPSDSYTVNNKITHDEAFIAAEKDGKKIAFFMSQDDAKGATGGELKGRGFGVNAYYLVGKKVDLGLSLQRYNDRSEGRTKNSGKAYMAGVHYYAAKGVTFFAGTRFDNWEAEQSVANAKIVGNDDAKFGMGSFGKKDQRTYFTGMNFAF